MAKPHADNVGPVAKKAEERRSKEAVVEDCGVLMRMKTWRKVFKKTLSTDKGLVGGVNVTHNDRNIVRAQQAIVSFCSHSYGTSWDGCK